MERAVCFHHHRGQWSRMARMEENVNVVDLTSDDEKVLTAHPVSTPTENSPSAMPGASCFMKDIREHDVLFSGPGGSLDMMNRHVGNVRFEKLCREMEDEFLSSSSMEDRRSIAQHVVAAIKGLGPAGRFLVVSRDMTANGAWEGKEICGQMLLAKVLQAFEIMLGLNNNKRKRSVHLDSRAGQASISSRSYGVVTPQLSPLVPEDAPSQSALAKLATAAEIARRPGPTFTRPPQVPILPNRPLPTLAYDSSLLPVRYSNINLSSLSDDFRHQLGLKDYVHDCYDGDYNRMATEHERLAACPHPNTWEVTLVEAAWRAFDICQKYINPGMKLHGDQQLHTRTVVPTDERALKRARFDQDCSTTESTTETLCAGTITDCKRTASRYVLYIARQLFGSQGQGGIAEWFNDEVLDVLEHGRPEAQEVAVLLLVLAAMEVNQDEKKFGGDEPWSFAGMFVIGSSVKLVPFQNSWRTRQRTPSYIRRISGRLLHFHEIVFTGASINSTRSCEFARWRPILEEPGRLGRSFVMRDLSTKFRIARHFEKLCDAPVARAPPPPPPPMRHAHGVSSVPVTPERPSNNSEVWVEERRGSVG